MIAPVWKPRGEETPKTYNLKPRPLPVKLGDLPVPGKTRDLGYWVGETRKSLHRRLTPDLSVARRGSDRVSPDATRVTSLNECWYLTLPRRRRLGNGSSVYNILKVWSYEHVDQVPPLYVGQSGYWRRSVKSMLDSLVIEGGQSSR